MKNFVQPGEVVTLPAPYAVASGGGLKVGAIVGIATKAAALNESVEAALCGVFQVAKAAGQTWGVGDVVYWDDTNKLFTTTATGNTKAGVTTAASTTSATTGWVRLNGAF